MWRINIRKIDSKYYGAIIMSLNLPVYKCEGFDQKKVLQQCIKKCYQFDMDYEVSYYD